MKEWQSGSEDGGEEDRRPLLGDPESGSCHIQQYPLPTPAAKAQVNGCVEPSAVPADVAFDALAAPPEWRMLLVDLWGGLIAECIIRGASLCCLILSFCQNALNIGSSQYKVEGFSLVTIVPRAGEVAGFQLYSNKILCAQGREISHLSLLQLLLGHTSSDSKTVAGKNSGKHSKTGQMICGSKSMLLATDRKPEELKHKLQTKETPSIHPKLFGCSECAFRFPPLSTPPAVLAPSPPPTPPIPTSLYQASFLRFLDLVILVDFYVGPAF
ncbi:Hypothetical predicted protein [Pelobates cultripes]|uniref:Uncharacterized protein n=1 Tax=Pelobates cultripes TaxID=61616 RepID=A0AAD1VUK3_PELCU|nr:Hypothetical predicted protein [Pelobates cultripes]